jgi:3-phenylpropionate/cinnamic acid dioxygenase small subunit
MTPSLSCSGSRELDSIGELVEGHTVRVAIDANYLITILSVRDLLTRYARLCDERNTDGWAALFTADARFVVRDLEYRGDAIRQWLLDQSHNPAGCHATMNVTVTPARTDAASAVADFVFVRRHEGTGPWEIINVGRYEDQLVRLGGNWLFRERVITLR